MWGVADPAPPGSAGPADPAKLQRDRELAKLAFGEDLDLVGGWDMDTAFGAVSDASRCGKLAALDELLELWDGPQAGARNKVRPRP